MSKNPVEALIAFDMFIIAVTIIPRTVITISTEKKTLSGLKY